ncbi:hypothetical protein L207DRAFT_518544 [Hyaloscypha variabilis F]|uniref:DUF7730 domain-containing protein n=1 Tax=Hyaloscypha variabilis (strain UAMH 11265 / GT02V1 / F) TaxID=1149755 RepID=A0A2J6R2B2_HYAVF|nr:hypothetical protein L207DRAFT_518544 [Hyaloscypha variabilis F]
MPLTTMELQQKAQNASRIEIHAKSTGVSAALLAALEKSKPTRSVPEQIVSPLSKTCQTVFKTISNIVNPPSSSSASKAHEHGVPTGLFRLPLEIREQIYGLVTGHKTVLKIPENYHKPRPSGGSSHNGSLSLLQTCRQIYVESSTSVYTQNTFQFENHNDFLAFAHSINPIFLSHITSLTFDLKSILRVGGTPYDHQCPRFTVHWIDDSVESQWSHVWDVIASMDNLTAVKVFLQDPGFPEWDGMQCLCLLEKEILRPLWKVKRCLEVFEMDVPWVDTSSWGSMKFYQAITEGARFNLTRRGINPMPRTRR